MGLLTEEVEVGLGGSNMNYFEQLGYVIPKKKDKQGRYKTPRGTKIKVKVSDLPHNSNVHVQVQCDGDGCGKISSISYNHYTKLDYNGCYYCHSCAMKLKSGENHSNWNASKTNEERLIARNYTEYTKFVKKVLARDNYTCQCCGKTNIKLCTHHLNGYNWYKEGRIDPTNGITLCENCHDNFHYTYGKGNNTKEQFEEWIGHTLKILSSYDGELQTARKIYCIEENKIYDSVDALSKQWNITRSQIYDVCNKKKSYCKVIKNKELKTYIFHCRTVCGKHLLWYDEYLNMSELDVKDFLNTNVKSFCKKVICITTGKIFESIASARRYYGFKGDISACCKGELKHSGKLPDGTKLTWMYYDDYLKDCNNNLIDEVAS